MGNRWIRLVLLDAGAWTLLSIGVGYAGHRLSDRWLRSESVITRPRSRSNSMATSGNVASPCAAGRTDYPRLESLFGGTSKRHLRQRKDMRRLVIETRRAELVHWALMACGPAFFLWNPPALGVRHGDLCGGRERPVHRDPTIQPTSPHAASSQRTSKSTDADGPVSVSDRHGRLPRS